MFITRAFVTVVVMIGIAHSTFGEDQCGDFVGSDVVLNRERVTWYSEGFTGAGFPEISGTSKTCERTITSSKPFVVILHDVTKSNTWFLALVIDDGDPEEQNLVTGDERIITIATKVVVTYIQMATSAGDKFGISFLPTTPDDVCDGIKTIEATPTPKYITTENFPGYYEHNTVCQLTLTTTADYITAEIEWIKLAGQCGEDQLHVRLSPGSPRITLSCSDVISGARFTDVLEYKSIGKTMNIDFSSDFENSESGFRIKIYSNPYDTAPKVIGSCVYDADAPAVTLTLEATPGDNGLDTMNLVHAKDANNLYALMEKDDIPCTITSSIVPDTDKMQITMTVPITTDDALTMGTAPGNCLVEVETLKDDLFIVMRALVKQIPGYTVLGDGIYYVGCNKKTQELIVETAELIVELVEEEATGVVALTEKLAFVDADTLQELSAPAFLGQMARLMVRIEDETWNVGYPVGVRVKMCTVRPFPDINAEQTTHIMIKEDGCVGDNLPGIIGDTSPLKPDAPFQAATSPPEGGQPVKTNYDPDPGVVYYAFSGEFSLAMFDEATTLYASCVYEYCYDEGDLKCFGDSHCAPADVPARRKRSVSNSTGDGTFTAAIVMQSPSFSFSERNPHTGKSHENIEDCFQSWIFVVVVVVLVLLLVLAVLVSFFLLFQMNKRKQDSKQVC